MLKGLFEIVKDAVRQEKKIVNSDPWNPITNPVDIKHLGKLTEELNECGSAVMRCLIQGIDEKEPTTGKLNREWLEDEIADVLANIELVTQRFMLNQNKIDARKEKKKTFISNWFFH